MNIKLPPTGLSGRFRLVVSEDAQMQDIKHDTGFFNNLITNVGMDRIGGREASYSANSNFASTCGRFVVGAGSAEPAFTDTALQSPVAFAGGNPVLDAHSSNYDRGWYELTVKHQFPQGAAAGNLSEIGIQRESASGPLWSRALILDGAGDPTTITVLPSDFLTCYYTLRIMIPKTDTVFNIDVDYGDDGGIIPTTVTARPLNANSSSTEGGWGFVGGILTGSSGDVSFFTGGLAAPTADRPLGSQVGGPVAHSNALPYVSGSYTRYARKTIGLNEINGTELRTARVNWLQGSWQLEFTPPLEKNDTQTMDVTFGYSWARA